VRLRSFALAMMVAMLAGPVIAAVIVPLRGAFGNAAGCAFYMTGGSIEVVDPVVVTPYTFTTSTVRCRFETLVSRRGASLFNVDGHCISGDARHETPATIVISDAAGGGVQVGVSIEGIGAWAALLRCPGTEDLFAPPGTQV
jgi:hypothetical protein